MSELVVIKPTTDLDELERQKRAYDALTVRLKMRSNDQCVAINGINNEQLYNILKANILYNQSVDQDYDLNDHDGNMTTESTVDKYINRLSLLSSDISLVESMNMDNQIKSIKEYGVEINVPPITPYFTPQEMQELIGESEFLEYYSSSYPTGLYNFNYVGTMNKVKELYEEYIEYPTESLEEQIISLGWNPSVEPNDRNIKLAHDRIYNNIKEKYNIEIVDVHDMIVQEDVDINKMNFKNMKPIFVMIVFRNSPFENLINVIKHSKYAHAAFALNSKLDKLFSYGPFGFVIESIDGYIKRYNKTKMKLLCTFVDKKSYEKILATISYYIGNKKKSRYSYSGCIKTLTGETVEDKFSLKMICSEFVDQLLKFANVSPSNKNSNLVIPNDFDFSEDTEKFFILYEGLCKDYDKSKVDKIVAGLVAGKPNMRKQLQLKEALDIMKYKDILLYKNISIVEENANTVLEELVDLLTPTPVISEVSFFKIDDNGNFKLNLPTDFQSVYNQSHKLLLEYDKNNNYEGMKEELCKLWYINIKIEKKLHSKFRKNKKELLDIRARVLNDFKKYLTKILSIQSDFSFSDYYKNSEYYDSSISIDKNTLKWSGKLLKSVFL